MLDIEGTTTPIDFVHKTLFPFARERMENFVCDNFPALGGEIETLKGEHLEDYAEEFYLKEFNENSPASIADYLNFLIDEDRKSTIVKSIQGNIWQKGYESGELKSVLFEDVPRAFERWKQQQKTIAIYSSGSILAQKQIFKYSNQGDLTEFIRKYFDTNTGGKKDSPSYEKIAANLNFPAADILFVSDSLPELEAAKTAGFQTAFSTRQGNAPLKERNTHPSIESFDEIN